LVGIEYRKPLEEWNRAGFVSITLCPPTFLIGDKGVGIDYRRAVLALACDPLHRVGAQDGRHLRVMEK
jgi:hypothetical protein